MVGGGGMARARSSMVTAETASSLPAAATTPTRALAGMMNPLAWATVTKGP